MLILGVTENLIACIITITLGFSYTFYVVYSGYYVYT